MPLPTLFQKGKVITNGMPASEKKRISEMLAVEYLMERVGSKLSYNDLPASVKSPANRVFILRAATGSGKGSIGPEIYKNHFDKLGRLILTTQPRIISAIRAATEDAVENYGNILKLGDNLGFMSSAMKLRIRDGVMYSTIGILLQQLKMSDDESIMRKYSCIILDEIHERSIEAEQTIYFLKGLISRVWDNPRCPTLIFTSATIEVNKFIKYFTWGKYTPEFIDVQGQSHPIEENYLEYSAGNYIWKIIDTVKEIHLNNDADFEDEKKMTDIMIFVDGGQVITKIYDILMEENKNFIHKIYPIPFTGTIYKAGAKEFKEFEAPVETLKILGQRAKRKVIITTNVAETSLTVDTLKYVIDSGYRLAVENDPLGVTVSIVKPVTKDMAQQRRGRVGRKAPGVWYPMFTKEVFEKMQEAKFPDMITSDITPAILSLVVKDDGLDIVKLDMMDKIPSDPLHNALEKLYVTGAIYMDGGDIKPTALGKLMNRFRKMSVENTRMLLAGYHRGGNILDLLTIAVLIEYNVKGRKYRPREVLSENRQKYLLSDTFIDNIFLFEEFRNVVEKQKMSDILDYCKDNAVNYNTMLMAASARDEYLEDIVGGVGMDPLYNGLGVDSENYSLSRLLKETPDIGITEVIKIKQCILDGYRLNIATRVDTMDGDYDYYTNMGNKIIAPNGVDGARFFVYSSISLRDERGTYNIRASDYYSILDNFVDIDISLV